MGMMQAGGTRALQAVVTRGQHEFADGLFFGGFEATWSNLTLRQVLREVASDAKRLAWIDIHTGLGPQGVGERILSCEPGEAEARSRAWWGAVTSIHDDSSTSTFLTGLMWRAAGEECPQAEYTGIALEFGTLPVLDVLQALRAGNWLHSNRRTGRSSLPEALVHQVARQMLGAFFIETDDWKAKVVSQGREAVSQAIAGLAAGSAPHRTAAPRTASSERSAAR